jgi:hypothetical protein
MLEGQDTGSLFGVAFTNRLRKLGRTLQGCIQVVQGDAGRSSSGALASN